MDEEDEEDEEDTEGEEEDELEDEAGRESGVEMVEERRRTGQGHQGQGQLLQSTTRRQR